MVLTDILSSFILGLLTPLGAVCVLPLYPGFLAYLANQSSLKQENTKKRYAIFGLLITLGVVIFMLLLGLLFTTLLQKSLTNVIGVVSPIAFVILAIISISLIFNFDFGRFFPKTQTPTSKKPALSALLYGFFFGAIVIPCNPSFIGSFFARALLFNDFLSSIFNFLAFGLGLGFPLLAFSLISANYSQKIIFFLTRNRRIINIVSGLIMLAVSLYYLVFIFEVFG